ncbi:MAG: ABC transporter permease subunit [Bacteroidales bacterium]|nr:ABC transporter permease subunit [Bacteroidales bacterium]
MKKGFQQILMIIATPITFAIIWHFFAPIYYLPSIKEIGNAFITMIENGTFFHDILISSFRALAGFFIGLFLGIIIGVFTGRFPRFFTISGGLLMFLRWTPVLAILPLTIRIGGLGEGPKIFLIAWACFFIVWIYTHVAINKLNDSYLWWSKSLGLTLKQKIFKILVPAVAPSLIGAARACLAIAMIVVVAAELSGTFQSGFFRDGLGYRIFRAIETNRNDINIACIITFGVIGIFYDFIFIQFIKRVLKPLTGIDFVRDAN